MGRWRTLAWSLIMSPGSCSSVLVERATRPLPLSCEITMHLIVVPTGMTDSTLEMWSHEIWEMCSRPDMPPMSTKAP